MDNEVRFELGEGFYSRYRHVKPPFGPVGEITYLRTYARPAASLPSRYYKLIHGVGQESWWVTVLRVVEGCFWWQKKHCLALNLPWDEEKAQRSAERMYDLMFNMKFLPPGRGLWMMGTDYVKKHGGAALNNCAFVSTENIDKDFSEPFCFLMDFSMLGVGVGGDIDGAGKVKLVKPKSSDQAYIVADSRDGWVNLLRHTLDAYVGRCDLPGPIDVSGVRPAGAPIHGFGGVSSGPGPLLELVVDIKGICERIVSEKDGVIEGVDIADIFNAIGRCVVSGNVRRSAEIILGSGVSSIGSFKDYNKYPHREKWGWASNNSVKVDSRFDFSDVLPEISRSGEPGFLFVQNSRDLSRAGDAVDYKDANAKGTNPCGEQTLHDHELCCLVETFPSKHVSLTEWKETLKYAYLYAKTVTLIPTHNPRVNAVTLKNRRIGTSITGVVQGLEKFGTDSFFTGLDSGYHYLKELDGIYSDWLCVPRSIKLTSVKPSGTVSLLPGVSPGMHFPHSEYYYRVIRFAADSPFLSAFVQAGIRCCELSPAEPNTVAVYFPVREFNFRRGKSSVTLWEQLELAAQLQYWWADNQVSCTVTFKPEEAKDIPRALEFYRYRLKSVSFLPIKDSTYEHAPYQEISKEEYERAVANMKPLEFTSGRNESVDKFCDGDRCEV